MFVLGLSEFIRNIRRNILIMIQMIAVYIIVIFTVSAFEEHYRLINGISDTFDETGMIVFKQSIGGEEFIKADVLEDLFIKVDNIDYVIKYNIQDIKFDRVINPDFNITVTSYNPDNISYKPKMMSGEWCEDAKHEDGVINAVVSNNMPFDYRIGEIIEYAGHRFKITGVVDTTEMVYGITNSFNIAEASYTDYFTPIYALNSKYPFWTFMVSYDDLMKYGEGDYNISSMWGMLTTIDFKDDITEEEMKYNMKQMTERYGHTEGCEMFLTEDIYEYSWELIMVKTMPMFMLLIVIMIVLVVSLIISGAINVLYERKNYGIYFICGNKWSKTFRFSVVNWGIMALTSMIIAGCACIYIHSSQMFDGLALSFEAIHVQALVAITIVMLIISVFIPFCMLRKIQPVSILKENDK